MTMAIPMVMTHKELRSELANTQLHIGELYHEKKDYKNAASWFKASAGNRNAAAYRSYANMLYDGQGVEKDAKVAVMWYNESATLGDAEAMFQLAWLYFNDRKSTCETTDLSRKYGTILMNSSAERGCSRAINYLKNRKPKHTMTLRSQAKF